MATETLTKTTVNCETGEVTIEPLTAEEIADREQHHAELVAREAKREAERTALAEAKTSALAKLAALGLTEEEAKAIVG
jgi:hypothetical protein